MAHFLLICIPVYFSSVQGERNSIHKNLVFCLFVAEVLFLAGVERTDDKVLSCQPRVTVMSHFVYKLIRDLESIDHLFINPIHRIGLINK